MSIHNSRQISDVKVLLKTGVDGAGIANIEKTGTSGLVDTYTITSIPKSICTQPMMSDR